MAENGIFSPTPENEHFPSFEDRVQSSRYRKGGGGRAASPTHSAHGSLIRSSIVQLQVEKKAKKVRFYRNGDRFFKGLVYAVSPERFRTFESLLEELTSSPVCDKNIMPNGVRWIFTVDGSKKITSVDEMEEGENYVCASVNTFRKIDYPRSNAPTWIPNTKPPHQGSASAAQNHLGEQIKEYIRPKLITVIRNGARPRKAVRILLNRKTAHCFEQVLTDITDAIKLETGACRKIFTLDGKQMTSLQDFFQEESVFIAYGPEKYSLDDFDLDGNEVKFVSAYTSVRQKERITLKSPKTPRRMTAASSRSLNEDRNSNTVYGLDLQIPKRKGSSSTGTPTSPRTPTKPPVSPRTPASPRTPRRAAQPKSPGPQRRKLTNGHTDQAVSLQRAPVELTEKYKIGTVIGEGNFAVVKQCMHRTSKNEFALKVINKSKCLGREQMIENEVCILRQVKHPNIIQLVDDFETPAELYLVMELVKGGDLFDAITTATKYTERDASGMLYNLMSAIKYLHTNNILHRDIKPENLMVCEYEDGSKALKLGDFGLAIETTEPLYVVCGTPTYVAPEVLAETGYGVKVDVWAAGVITYILLSGFPPFVSEKNDHDELFDKIMSGKFTYASPFWDDISNSAKELISCMLVVDPEDRFSAEDVIDHPWVADDMAKDKDMHSTVTTRIGQNFSSRKYRKHVTADSPGVALIAATALDKSSRFFQGPRHQVALQEFNNHNTDEIF